jgi:restriction endonuclease Mrr
MKERWEYSIFQCIDALGGKANLQEIYKKITDFIELTEEHLKESYERPAYQHQIRSHITNMCQSGELTKISRGCYSLTKKGREKLSREKPIEL